MKKNVIKYLSYALTFVLLGFLEGRTGLKSFSIPFFFALVFLKQNVLVIAPLLLVSGIAFNFNLWSLLFYGTPIVITLVALFIHYKTGRQLNIAFTLLYDFLSFIPIAVVSLVSLESLLKALGSLFVSLPLTNAYVVFLNAIINKKLNFKLAKLERLCFLAVAVVFGYAFSHLKIYFFECYLLVGIAFVCFLPLSNVLSTVEFSVAYGLGGVLIDEWYFVLMTAIGVLTALMPKKHGYFGGILGIVTLIAIMLLKLTDVNYFRLIAPMLGVIANLAIPTKWKDKIVKRFAFKREGHRALINKDRADMKDKLNGLSGSLNEIAASLSDEKVNVELDAMELAVEVSRRVCYACARYQHCKKCLGGAGTEIVIQELMSSAIALGKASILDASPFLSSRCLNITGVIVKANEVLIEKRTAIKKQADEIENVRLLKEQVEGLGSVLSELAFSCGTPLKYDAEEEKRIRDALNLKGIYVGDVIADENGRVLLTLKEGDESRTEVRDILSKVLGTQMRLNEIKQTVNGCVAVFFSKEPRYRVAYGERVVATSFDGSGDHEAVVKLNDRKVMLCLSDGMGHGKEASKNSSCALSLITSLYKAGFDHLTVLKSVQTLLKVRNKEEFNAIDIAVIDTESGDVDVIKQGAREGYVITPDGLEEIGAGSLPLGIVEGAEPITVTKRLTPRDFIVMFSDGVIDGIGKENLEELLSKIYTCNPDEVCSAVMENVERLAPDERDDCSMICARLF